MSIRVFFLGIWPLFMGLFFIMAGNSVQGALVAYRLGLLGHSNLTSGIVLAGYSVGMVIAVSTMPYFIKSVGHIRVFAAMATTVSAALLIFPLLVYPSVWFLLRLVIGFCYIGLYVVAEAWINALATNEFRGRMMSFYMMTQFLGFIAGQFTLRFTTPESATLFIVGAVAISLSTVPILMVKINVPMKSEYSKRMPLRQLYKYSPFAVLGTSLVAMQFMPFYTALGFFAQKANMNLRQLSVLSIFVLLSGTIAQWPLARISDRIDRRNVLMTASILASCFAIVGLTIDVQNITVVYILTSLVAFCILPLYAINLAHANDVIPSEKIVAAGSTIQMMNASGSMIGPIVLSLFIDHLNAPGFFAYVICISAMLTLFTLYRIKSRQITIHRRAFFASFLQLRSTLRDPRSYGIEKPEKWDISKRERPRHTHIPIFDSLLDRWLKTKYINPSTEENPNLTPLSETNAPSSRLPEPIKPDKKPTRKKPKPGAQGNMP